MNPFLSTFVASPETLCDCKMETCMSGYCNHLISIIPSTLCAPINRVHKIFYGIVSAWVSRINASSLKFPRNKNSSIRLMAIKVSIVVMVVLLLLLKVAIVWCYFDLHLITYWWKSNWNSRSLLLLLLHASFQWIIIIMSFAMLDSY